MEGGSSSSSNHIDGRIPLSPSRSPPRSPTYFEMIGSPLDLLGRVAAQHDTYTTDEYNFTQLSNDIPIYDHQLNSNGNSNLMYQTYAKEYSNSKAPISRTSSTHSFVKKFDGVDPPANTTMSTDIKDERVASAMAATAPPFPMPSAPTPSTKVLAPSRGASDTGHSSIHSSVAKKTVGEANSKSNLLYLSPEVRWPFRYSDDDLLMRSLTRSWSIWTRSALWTSSPIQSSSPAGARRVVVLRCIAIASDCSNTADNAPATTAQMWLVSKLNYDRACIFM